MTDEQEAAQREDQEAMRPWEDLMNWLVDDSGLSPECVRELAEAFLDLREGKFCGHLSRRASKIFGASTVTEYPGQFSLERPGKPPVVIGTTFKEALDSINSMAQIERDKTSQEKPQ